MAYTRNILVTGAPNSKITVYLKNSAGQTYNHLTQLFETGINPIDIYISEDGTGIVSVNLPTTTSNDTYDLSYITQPGVELTSEMGAMGATVDEIYDYPVKTITWTTSHSTAGYTIAAGLQSTKKISGNSAGAYGGSSIVAELNVTGAITKSSALLYTTAQPNIARANGGDFTNSNFASYDVALFNPPTGGVMLSDDTNLIDGMNLINNTGENIVMSKDGSDKITLTGYRVWPKFNIGDTLDFSMCGHDIYVSESTITGTGTTSLTATSQVFINRVGNSDTTITWRLEESITTVPNAYNMAVNCSISEATTSFSVQDGNGVPQTGIPGTCSKSSANNWTCTVQQDIDANKDSKTYSLVSKSGMTVDGELRGTIGNNSTAFDNDTFYTGGTVRDKITFKYAAGEVGETCSFTYRLSDGTTTSATKTVTITLTA